MTSKTGAVCRGSYLSRFIGQEVAPGLSCERGLVAVASSGLFPQPLWISVRAGANLGIVVKGRQGCQGMSIRIALITAHICVLMNSQFTSWR